MTGNSDILLVQKATNDDLSARREVVAIADPIITRQTNRYCRKYCYEQNYYLRCTLLPPVNGAPSDAAMCEWGNGSYAWMLEELTKNSRLKKYQAKNDASLADYFFVIVNSLSFYERWKDWRFNNRIYVPEYIESIHSEAKKVFRCLRRQLAPEEISQESGLSVDEVKKLSTEIIKALLIRRRMYLLTPSTEVSYNQFSESDNDVEHEMSIVVAPNETDFRQSEAISAAFNELSILEQHVISGFFIEKISAKHILKSIKKIDWPENVAINIKDIQQLYYFRRKSVKHLYELFHDHLNSKRRQT